jgi:hypothetical protein
LYSAAAAAVADDVVADVEQAADWLRTFVDEIDAAH